MSFAESYLLASKVRSKLTREAANPKTPLRSLVLQANMLDNLMDHISVETEKKLSANKVSFSLPSRSPLSSGSSVTEYEVDLDSDSDSDDADYYYSSEEEEDEEEEDTLLIHRPQSYRRLPTMDLSLPEHDLLLIPEEEGEEADALPELSRSSSNSDSEPDEEVADVHYALAHAPASHKLSSEDLLHGHGHGHSRGHPASHHRHDAIYLMKLLY